MRESEASIRVYPIKRRWQLSVWLEHFDWLDGVELSTLVTAATVELGPVHFVLKHPRRPATSILYRGHRRRAPTKGPSTPHFLP